MAVKFQIPDEALGYLRFLAEQDTDIQWLMGDLLVDVWDELRDALPAGSERKAHASMVHQFAQASGVAQSTLRERENVCRFFPKENRNGVLTYHQHRAIKSADSDWERWMEWALDNNASVDQIRKAIADEKNPTPEWRKRMERIQKIAWSVSTDETAPEDARAGAELIRTLCEDNLSL